jgi:hypothetical protein
MSPDLPFDIIALIIDVVGESKNTKLLKELALLSHSFLQICTKHLFATIDLHDANPDYHVASSKKGFVKLLKSRPDVVKYIRKLKYTVYDDDLLSPILPNLLRTISRLKCFKIDAFMVDWNALDSSLTSAFLHLMQLPTINRIDLSCIRNFPLSGLTSSVNLLRLDMSYLSSLQEDGSAEIVVQSEMMPKIRELRISSSALLTTKLLHAKTPDGRPAFNFMDLRRLSIGFQDEWNIQYLLQNAKLLEKLHLSVKRGSLWGLHDILSPIACTLKFLDLTISICDSDPLLAGLCEELEAMAGQYVLEALSFYYPDGHGAEDSIGSIIQNVEKVLVKPGWSALRQVSFDVNLHSLKLYETLQSSLPDKYLSHLLKFEFVDSVLNRTIHVVKCTFKF